MRLSSNKLLGPVILLCVGVYAQGWTATLALNAFSNIVGGANAIASSCPKSPQGSCAVGAIQVTVGAILGIAAGANAFFGFWKRDEDGFNTFVLTTDPTMPGAGPIDRDHLKTMAMNGPLRMQLLLHGDDTVRHGAYHYNNVTGHHKVYSRFDGQPVNMTAAAAAHNKRQEETIDGDDGFVGDFVDFNIDDWEGTDTSSTAASNYANDIESQLEANNADSACVEFSHDSTVDSELWLQPASDSTFTGVATQCQDPIKRRQDQPEVQVNLYIDPTCQDFATSVTNVFEAGQCAQFAGFLGALCVQGGVNCQAYLTLDCTGQPLTPVFNGVSDGNTFWGDTSGQCAGFEAHPGSFNCIAA